MKIIIIIIIKSYKRFIEAYFLYNAIQISLIHCRDLSNINVEWKYHKF